MGRFFEWRRIKCLGSLEMVNLKARPKIAPLPKGLERDRAFRYWQKRVMFGMMVGYACFYLVRKNISMALPGMGEELGYSNAQLGLLLTGTSLVYGVGKFVNGILADRAYPRYFMALGLVGSALINLCFGLSSVFWIFMLLWLANGWAQSMGWPPCATLLTSWYERSRLATWWGLWNASHQIGGALIFILGGYLISAWGWRAVFFTPALLALLGVVVILWGLRDRPQAQGFPSPHQEESEDHLEDALEEPVQTQSIQNAQTSSEIDTLSALEQTKRYILTNPMIWLVSFGNLFVYIVRIGMLDWAPKFLKEGRGVNLEEAGWMVAALEVAGILGGLGAGYLADRTFKGRYSLVNALYMVALVASLIFLFFSPQLGDSFQGVLPNALILSVVGFLVYGPQMLTAVSAAAYAPRECSGAATGFNGLFGYFGASIAGVGTGLCVDHYGWDGGVLFYTISAVLGVLCFFSAHFLSRVWTSQSLD